MALPSHPRIHTTREAFDEAVGSALTTADGTKHGVLLVGEIDDFAALATSRGTRYADAAAATIVRLIAAMVRGDDIVLAQPEGRILVWLSGGALAEARHVAERICCAARLHPFPETDKGAAHRVTCSIGVAGVPEHGSSVAAVYSAADAACARIAARGKDGAGLAPLAHHKALHRPLSIKRLAGRSEEFGTLVRLLDDAVSGRPHVVTVLGESGLGTAMLLRQIEPEVRLRGGSFIAVESPSSPVVTPYGVWSALIRGINRLPDPPVREWRELPKLVPALGGKPEDGAGGSQYRLLDELADFVRAAAATRLLVLVIDEIQWLDVTSWEALEHVMGQLEGDHLLICLSARSEREFTESTDRRQVFKRHQVYSELQLNRLTRDEMKHWLEAAFHRQEIGREFLAFLYRQTEGNPFFVTQLLHALVEEGALWHSGERWEWSPVSELRLPSGLGPLVARRLSRFSSSTQAVLNTAAIIGRAFDVDLAVASGSGSEPAVRLAVIEAQAADLVRPAYERQGGGYEFVHEHITSAFREMNSRDRAARVHERVAHALVARGGRPLGEIALHYDAAGAHAAAYSTAQAAAKAAEQMYAHAAAQSYLHVALRNATTPAQLAELRAHLAQLAETAGRYDEVEELCDLAVEWFDGQHDYRRAISLRTMRERARMGRGQPARVTLDALLALDTDAKARGLDRERVMLLRLASQTYGRLGDRRMAERIATDCVEMAERLDDKSLLAESLLRLGSVILYEAPAKAEELLRRALGLFESLAEVHGQARCHNNIGIVAQFEGRLDDAQQAYEMAVSISRAGGMVDHGGASALNLGVLLKNRGEYDRARELFGEALASFATVKNSEYQLIALFNMGHCELEVQNWEEAAELYGATFPLAERIGQSDVEIASLAGAALCFIEMGEIDRARSMAGQIQERMLKRPDWFQNRELVEAVTVRLAVLDGRQTDAVSWFEGAIAMVESADVYAAAWLTAACAPALFDSEPERLQAAIGRYAEAVERLGYGGMTRRYKALAAAG